MHRCLRCGWSRNWSVVRRCCERSSHPFQGSPTENVRLYRASKLIEGDVAKKRVSDTSCFQGKDQQSIYVKPSSGLDFPGVDHLREQINRALIETDYKLQVTLDCARIATLDYTSMKGIESLINDMKKQQQSLTLLNLDEKLREKLNSFK